MRDIYKIVFLGNSAVGKTSLISQYLYSKVHNPAPTIAIDFLTTSLELNGKKVKLQVWDTAGQERFNSIVGNYTRNTFLAVVVYSVNSYESLYKVETWINDFVLSHNSKDSIKIIVVANKIDLDIDQKDILEKGKEIALRSNAEFVSTSSLTNEGIKEMVDKMTQIIAEDMEKEPELEQGNPNALTLKAVPQRRCC